MGDVVADTRAYLASRQKPVVTRPGGKTGRLDICEHFEPNTGGTCLHCKNSLPAHLLLRLVIELEALRSKV